ncbi:hypothetical protein DSO57_1019895 [Entomophthora muscae]|uniref:Uncharacterized protein n=1 Tax=Entomophthora muscae TaxID=34485 RepID=A0ACC2TEV5_9FUNG|nr:hypothetical protein DSO57_1019895 [Entomophthora muscae]
MSLFFDSELYPKGIHMDKTKKKSEYKISIPSDLYNWISNRIPANEKVLRNIKAKIGEMKLSFSEIIDFGIKSYVATFNLETKWENKMISLLAALNGNTLK